MVKRIFIALSIWLLASFTTAVAFAIIYAVTDIYLSGHSIEYENPVINLGITETTAIDLAFLITSTASGILAAWLYDVNNFRNDSTDGT